MEDVIGIVVTNDLGVERALVAWGRAHDAVDEEPLLAQLGRVLPTMINLGKVVDVRICRELGEISDYEYFYEALITFASRFEKAEGNRKFLKRLAKDDRVFRKSLYLLGKRRSPG